MNRPSFIRWNLVVRLPIALAGLLAIVGLSGFESYRYPLETVLRDPALQRRVREATESGQDPTLYGDHHDIAKECLSSVGMNARFIEGISRTASDIDYDNFVQKKHYEAQNHCDRNMKTTDAQAFRDCLVYFRKRVAEAWNTAAYGSQPDEANFVKILPRALHAQADFFSHSNFIDLAPEAQDAFLGCWTRLGATQAGTHDDLYKAIDDRDHSCLGPDSDGYVKLLKVTGFDPTATNWYRPPDVPYPHAQDAKDGPTYPPGPDKYLQARRAAVGACKSAMTDFKRICMLDSICSKRYQVFFSDASP